MVHDTVDTLLSYVVCCNCGLTADCNVKTPHTCSGDARRLAVAAAASVDNIASVPTATGEQFQRITHSTLSFGLAPSFIHFWTG